MLRRWIACGMPMATLTALVLLARPSQARDLCADLTVLLNAQPGFADLRGGPAPDDRWHVKSLILGDIGECTVGQDGRKSDVMCASTWMTDGAAADARFATIVSAVKKCFGPNWRASDSQVSDALKSTLFHDKNGGDKYFSAALYRQPPPSPQ